MRNPKRKSETTKKEGEKMDYNEKTIRQSRESLRILLRTRDDFQKMRIRIPKNGLLDIPIAK